MARTYQLHSSPKLLNLLSRGYETLEQFNETACECLQAHSRVPPLADEPALHGKRSTLSHLFRVRRPPPLKQAWLDQAARVLLLGDAMIKTKTDLRTVGNNLHATTPLHQLGSASPEQRQHSGAEQPGISGGLMVATKASLGEVSNYGVARSTVKGAP